MQPILFLIAPKYFRVAKIRQCPKGEDLSCTWIQAGWKPESQAAALQECKEIYSCAAVNTNPTGSQSKVIWGGFLGNSHQIWISGWLYKLLSGRSQWVVVRARVTKWHFSAYITWKYTLKASRCVPNLKPAPQVESPGLQVGLFHRNTRHVFCTTLCSVPWEW